jgi:hypothetical protein
MGYISRQPGNNNPVGALTSINSVEKYLQEIGMKIAAQIWLRLTFLASGPGEVQVKISA